MSIQKRVNASGKIRWVARYRNAAGKEYSKSFSTQREAKAWEAEQLRDVRRGVWVDPIHSKYTLYQAMDDYTQRDMRRGTREVWDFVINNLDWFGEIPVQSLTRVQGDRWYRQLVEGRPWADGIPLGRRSAATCMAKVRAALRVCVDDGIISRVAITTPRIDGSNHVEPRSIPGDVEVDAVVNLLRKGGFKYQGIGEGGAGPQPAVASAVMIAALSGLRVGEVCGLQVGDVDLFARVLHVRRQLTSRGVYGPTKTPQSVRDVPLSQALEGVVRPLVEGRDAGEPLLVGKRGSALKQSMVHKCVQGATEHLGYSWSFHALRHRFASVLISGGVSVPTVARLLGHGSPSVTMRVYAHLIEGDEDRARAAIDGAQLAPRGLRAV